MRLSLRPGPASPRHAADAPRTPDPELLARRDRLTERLAMMQSELGGAFYEMAIRDHVRLDVLMRRAAELQQVDTELGAMQQLVDRGAPPGGGSCGGCGSTYPRGAAFCGQCAQPLTP
jgi:hypothetical protein